MNWCFKDDTKTKGKSIAKLLLVMINKPIKSSQTVHILQQRSQIFYVKIVSSVESIVKKRLLC